MEYNKIKGWDHTCMCIECCDELCFELKNTHSCVYKSLHRQFKECLNAEIKNKFNNARAEYKSFLEKSNE